MDQKPHKSEQIAMSHESISESSTPVKKPHIQATKHLDSNFMSPTPESTDKALFIRSKKEPAILSDKHKILSDLFNSMTTSLRLLNLHKKLPTFKNLCLQVEKLTGRKFSYMHLAQMKFILPEAIQTDKILLHNNKTLTMEPDIKVKLLFDVVEGHTEHSDHIALCITFSDRLLKFVCTHSEGCDVPEAELPEPFNQKEIKITNVDSISEKEKLQNVEESEIINPPSHLDPSFSRHFTKKENEDTIAEKEGSYLDPVKVKHESTFEPVVNECTPMKPPLLHDRISVLTPDLSTPKRSMATEDNNLKNMASQKEMGSSVIAKKSLNFSNLDNEVVVFEEKAVSVSVPSGKYEEKSCLSDCDLVETIYNIFLSANFSSITKSELSHKILVNNFDIIENGEIEDQIDDLVKKVPDWISKKVASSGDLLYNINKGLDLKSVTEKLM
ncbi:hypothetical protein LXL04_035720 [Taraxacum kok-saghyz]